MSRGAGLVSIPEGVFPPPLTRKNKPDANKLLFFFKYTFPVLYTVLAHSAKLRWLSFEMRRVSEWAGVHLLFPRVSVLLLPGQETVSVPHSSNFLKAGVLLPPLGAGNMGQAEHGRHCDALEEASLWEAQGGHLFILLMSFP